MAYFEDLTHYKYFPMYSWRYRNVGWLSEKHLFPTGLVSDSFIEKLEKLCRQPTNLCRGYHWCEFCENSENLYEEGGCGNGEIHVKGRDGKIYVAPVLILHYVKKHNYLPPSEFISAVEKPQKIFKLSLVLNIIRGFLGDFFG